MKKLILLVAVVCVGTAALSSHLRCGYITVTRESCTSRNVFIIITVFTNTASEVRFGEDGILSFGDGNTMVVEGKDHTYRPDLGPDVGEVRAIISYTYAATGSYLISYMEPNRNGGVLNMTDSFFTTFYTETKFSFSEPCNSSPKFLATPIFSGFTNDELQFSLGASSPSDKLITYEMAVPFRDRGLPVAGYVQPPNMQLNELTGLLNWNTELVEAGEYNFAVVAFQWMIEEGQYKKAGFVRIDFQVILNDDGPDVRPLYDDQEFEEYNRVLVKPGEEKTIEIFYEPASGSGTMEMFSELNDESVSFSSQEVAGDPGTFKGTLTLTPQEADQRKHGYMITIRGKSSGSSSDRSYLIYTDEILEFPAFDPVTGVEKDLAQVDIFPNPFQNQLNIQVNRAGRSEVVMFTAHGALLKSKVFESETILTLTDLPAGVYICDVRRNNLSVKRIKLIKTE